MFIIHNKVTAVPISSTILMLTVALQVKVVNTLNAAFRVQAKIQVLVYRNDTTSQNTRLSSDAILTATSRMGQ